MLMWRRVVEQNRLPKGIPVHGGFKSQLGRTTADVIVLVIVVL